MAAKKKNRNGTPEEPEIAPEETEMQGDLDEAAGAPLDESGEWEAQAGDADRGRDRRYGPFDEATKRQNGILISVISMFRPAPVSE